MWHIRHVCDQRGTLLGLDERELQQGRTASSADASCAAAYSVHCVRECLAGASHAVKGPFFTIKLVKLEFKLTKKGHFQFVRCSFRHARVAVMQAAARTMQRMFALCKYLFSFFYP